jgi:hypothetical protein
VLASGFGSVVLDRLNAPTGCVSYLLNQIVFLFNVIKTNTIFRD